MVRKLHSHFLQMIVCIVVIASSLSACNVRSSSNGSNLEGAITVSGAWALYPLMVRWAEVFHELYPGINFDVSAGGAGKGMADVLAGAVDLGMVSREVTAQEQDNGAFPIAVAKDAVFVTFSAVNPYLTDLLKQGVRREGFIGVFLHGDIHTWGELLNMPEITDPIHVYTRSDAAGAPETWAKYLGGLQEDLIGIGVYGDPGILDAVSKDPLGIGYNNLNFAFDPSTGKPVDGAAVMPIDVNENGIVDPDEVLDSKVAAIDAVALGRYPSPPARILYLVADGKPSSVLQVFLQWVLTDGQVYLDEVGYIPLSQELIQAEVTRLK